MAWGGVALALLLASGAPQQFVGEKPPPYFTALERWSCTFPAFTGKDSVTENYGVFRSHVESEFHEDYTVAQNDAAALVFVFSDFGNTDMEGKTRRWTTVNVIDKRSRAFKTTVIDMDGPTEQRQGRCRPY